jgi:hypothetical protein
MAARNVVLQQWGKEGIAENEGMNGLDMDEGIMIRYEGNQGREGVGIAWQLSHGSTYTQYNSWLGVRGRCWL